MSDSGYADRPSVVVKVLVCLFVCWIGLQAARPLVEYNRARAEGARLERRVKQLEQANQELRAQAALLNRAGGPEGDARRMGYLDKGQAPLVFATGQPDR